MKIIFATLIDPTRDKDLTDFKLNNRLVSFWYYKKVTEQQLSYYVDTGRIFRKLKKTKGNTMKDINVEDLQNLLEISKLALSSQDFVPIMNHICFDGEQIMSCNGIDTIRIPFETDFVCAVPGDLFLKCITSLKGEPEIVLNEMVLSVKTKKSHLKFPVLSEDQFIQGITEQDAVQCSAVCSDLFLQGLKLCLLTIDDTPNQFQDNGIYLQNGYLFSTNKVCISKHESGLNIEFGEEPSILIPASFCSNVLFIVSKLGSEGLQLNIRDSSIDAIFENGTIVSAKILDGNSGQARDFDSVIADSLKELTDKVAMPPDFIDCLKRITMFFVKTDEKKMVVTIKQSGVGSTITLQSKTKLGEIKECFNVRGKLPETEFEINAQLLLKGFQHDFLVSFSSSCMVVEKDSYIQLISYMVEE